MHVPLFDAEGHQFVDDGLSAVSGGGGGGRGGGWGLGLDISPVLITIVPNDYHITPGIRAGLATRPSRRRNHGGCAGGRGGGCEGVKIIQ